MGEKTNLLTSFAILKSFIKVQSVTIDGNVCKMHYRLTVMILLGLSVLVTITQHFGDPIKCQEVQKKDNLPMAFLEKWCLLESKYTLKTGWNLRVGTDVIYPGVINSAASKNRENENIDSDDFIYHNYYLWVPFVLFILSCTFYIPRLIWKTNEGGTMKAMVTGLKSPTIPEDLRQNGLNAIVTALKRNTGNNNTLFMTCLLCESFYLVNVILQMYFMNQFLRGSFLSYGWKALTFTDWSHEISDDPFRQTFPTLTACKFSYYGPSRDITQINTICLLPINILNQKLFLFLWIWYLILFILTSLSLIFRILTVKIPFFRKCLITRHCFPNCHIDVDRIIRISNLGDWFMLHLLSINLNRRNFSEIIAKYNETLCLSKNK
ncbi:innexin inx2-like protein, partial [Leptotrombidium deliense]